MANQRILSAYAGDGSPSPIAQPGATLTDFPITAQDAVTATTSTVEIAEDGAILLFCSALIHVEFDGTVAAIATGFPYPAGLHLVPVAAGDTLSVISATGTTLIHARLAR
tara:strand:+ start:274 stop:603 length:330 start_codon:yes stop_codon:yes gene_type:complete